MTGWKQPRAFRPSTLGGALHPLGRLVIGTVGVGTVVLLSVSSTLREPFLLSFAKRNQSESISQFALPAIVILLLCFFMVNTMNRSYPC